jgi:segregation and condensation protein A
VKEDPPPIDDRPIEPTPIAFAHLYGEPLFDLPKDLYIPPEALEVFLDAFHGPLDLLLYLIRKQNFNILDIPMAEVTTQYLSYVEQIRNHNLELAAEYLLMAAMLIEIKSRLLLPPKPRADGEGEPEDPRAELVRRLLEYEQIKLAAAQLEQMPVLGRDFWRPHIPLAPTPPATLPLLPPPSIAELQNAWQDILKRAKLKQHHKITREQLSVREYMGIILKRLQNQRFLAFEALFDLDNGVQALIVTFIAMLELSRERLLELTQAEAFAPIYVRLAYQAV